MLKLYSNDKWYELQTYKKENTIDFDIDNFKIKLCDHISLRNDKLNFINVSFYNLYPKYNISNIIYDITDEKYNRICNMIDGEKYHPILSFHGTTSLDIVNSILAKGYIIPGTIDNSVKKSHGSIYGNGVYTSPHFDKAFGYSKINKDKKLYVLFNFVFVGKMRMIPPGNKENSISNGVFDDGCHTHIVFGLEQIISTDPSKVIPLGYLEIDI